MNIHEDVDIVFQRDKNNARTDKFQFQHPQWQILISDFPIQFAMRTRFENLDFPEEFGRLLEPNLQ